MSETLLNPTDFSNNLYAFLEETFESHHGIFLDKGNSLLETLETVTAEQASIPVGGKCASLAAQVAHVIFYIESFERYALQNDHSPVDWGEIWRSVEKVTPEEWDVLRARLKETYQRISELFHKNTLWNEMTIGGTMGVLCHTIYHLGEIRQALCTLR
jgi:hypothetical protein